MKAKPISTQAAHLPLGELRDGRFYHKHILSVKQFSRADIDYIFTIAEEMRTIVARVGGLDLLKGKIMANLFYEASTRTSSSFTAAMERLGGSVIPISDVRYSSVSKGESLPDTVRTLECYADVIVLRHPEKGSAAIAAKYLRKPLINAGDGTGEHPTQALLDLFTIQEELGEINGKVVTMVGDLKFGRTVHSLARLLTLYGATLNYVSPDILRMPDDIVQELAEQGAIQNIGANIDAVLPQTDVLYVTRVQKERFENLDEYEELKDAYVISPKTLTQAKPKMIVMHPLPRVGEITMDVDSDPRAAYFRQMEYGLYVRMALLAMVLGKA